MSGGLHSSKCNCMTCGRERIEEWEASRRGKAAAEWRAEVEANPAFVNVSVDEDGRLVVKDLGQASS